MGEEKNENGTASDVQDENRRKLEEHLKKMLQRGGKAAEGEKGETGRRARQAAEMDAAAYGSGSRGSGQDGEEGGIPEPPRLDAATR
ncbi:MAG: hypothetical protein OEZ59_08795, partial [Deltaproteobacteria bacterium]|nr:hypothetical protein [Deltaproteobacteria bacterium]